MPSAQHTYAPPPSSARVPPSSVRAAQGFTHGTAGGVAATLHVAAPPRALVAAPRVGDGAMPATVAPNAPSRAELAATNPGGTFSVTAGKDDTALFRDARVGFSHLLPGRPVLGLGAPRHGDPPADAIVQLQDAPITLRYTLVRPPVPVVTAADAVRMTAEHYALSRLQPQGPRPPAVDLVHRSWLVSWGVEAGAVAAYEVGGHREDLFVLANQGRLLAVTWTYPRGFVEDPAYAAFASVAEATMVWDPARWEQRGRVWPESALWGAGLFPQAKPKHHANARALAAAVFTFDERAALFAVLGSIVTGAGAPWIPLAPEVIERCRRSILAACRAPAVTSFVSNAFCDVTTAHDLRGVAVLMGRALDVQPPGTSSAPPPASGVRAPR